MDSAIDAFVCPECKRVSHNPNDAKNKYCGACDKSFPLPGVVIEHHPPDRRISAHDAHRLQIFRECPDCRSHLTEGPHGGHSVNWYCPNELCGSRFNDMGPFGVERIEAPPADAGVTCDRCRRRYDAVTSGWSIAGDLRCCPTCLKQIRPSVMK